MKKILVIIILLFVAQDIVAQSNTILLYGNINYTHSNRVEFNREVISNNLNISPGIGYQFDDHWTAGLEFNLIHTTSKSGNSPSKSTYFSAGPFVRYQYQLTDMFSFITHLGSQFRLTNMKDYNTMQINVSPGIRMDIKNDWALNFFFGNLGITHTNNKIAETRNSQFDVGFGRSTGLGISKNFGTK